jgi:glyoxylase-like metal-dependent hydrolase (beta-lactamase superfamily II)
MVFDTRIDNVYVIDTCMFDFPHYQSCYLVEGEEVVLIDTGLPSQLDKVRSGIQKHGFSLNDISRIFLTHCEHPDHAGNVGTFIKENPNLTVYINPVGMEYLTAPSVESENRKKVMLPQMAARFGEQLPVPRSRIQFLKDGEVFDIGNEVKLKIMFTPGHQPSGLVIFDEKSQGLFIDDLVGNYFIDADFSLILTPPRSDVIKTREFLISLLNMPVTRLYLGHFGISKNPEAVIHRALDGIQRIMDIAEQCVREGKPEQIEPKVLASKMPELEKLKNTRGNALYEYTRNELVTHHSTYFAQYYLEQVRNKGYL